MQALGLILILLNVGAIVGPIAGVVVVYHNDLQAIVVPPEVQQIVGNTINTLTLSSPNSPATSDQTNSSNVNLEMPQYVNACVDPASRTVTAVFNFTNPFSVSLTINALSADVVCHAHGFLLGNAVLSSPVEFVSMQTADITIVFTYSVAAQQHVESEHAGQSTVNVDLKNITINISGITVQTPETYNVDIPLSL
jgi:hypothetical protein